MSTSVASVLERYSGVNKQQASTQEQANKSKFPIELPVTQGYLEDSEFYQIRGGLIAEVIQNPFVKFIDKGITERVIQDLRKVTLAAFGKTEDQTDLYASDEVMRKNAIMVDWLIVVRKKDRLVAFSSASFITRSLLCLNAAMVVPEEQPTGVGVIASSLMWELAVDNARRRGVLDPDIVARTHNRNAASVLLHIFKNSKLSTEPGLDNHTNSLIEKTADYLGCVIDKQKGISYNVYPEGLPAGTKSQSQRINAGFENVSSCDACYVSGRLDIAYTQKLIQRKVKKVGLQPEIPVRNRMIPVMMPAYA
jgi:hypothetical protein